MLTDGRKIDLHCSRVAFRSALGNAVRDMIVSVAQIPLLLDNVMRITPSDQASNSDLSYRAGRWIAVAVRPRTYAARLPRSDLPILVTISASAVPQPRTAFSASASFKPPSASKH